MRARLWAVVLVVCILASAGLIAPRGASAVTPTPIIPPIIPPIEIPILPLIDPALQQQAAFSSPLYRLIKTQGAMYWYGYTSSEAERTWMKSQGWVDNGIVTYVSRIRLSGTYPLYRWLAASRTTFLTIDPTTNAASLGYYAAGIVGYVMQAVPPASVPPGQQLIYRYTKILLPGQPQYYSNHYYTSNPSWPTPPSYTNYGWKFRAWTTKVVLQKVTVQPFASGLTGGSSATIKWSTSSPGGVVELMYTEDDGDNWISIVKNYSNAAGQYVWTVPNISSTKCHIMVRWSGAAYGSASAWSVGAGFTITKNLILPIRPFVIPIIVFDLQPAAPTNLVVTGGTGATPSIELFWEDNSPAETGFAVERKTGAGPFAVITTTAANAISYSDTTAAPETEYTYRVKAKGPTLDSEYSNEGAGIYYPPDTDLESIEPETPPATLAPPTNLQVLLLPGSERMVRVSWVGSTAGSVLGYSVERNTTGAWEPIADLGATIRSFIDGDLADGSLTEASYRVKAFDELVYSEPSNEATMPFPSALPMPTYDGTQSAWAEPELTLAYQSGLTYPGVMYDFQRQITREEFCTIVVKLYEKLAATTAVPGDDPFDDTDNPDILKAYALGIVRGVAANLFAPYNNITRQEMCVMIFRALQAAGESTAPTPGGAFPFTDSGSVAPWAINEVRFCYHNNIMKGTSPTTISPLLNTPREQAIVLIVRTYEAFK